MAKVNVDCWGAVLMSVDDNLDGTYSAFDIIAGVYLDPFAHSMAWHLWARTIRSDGRGELLSLEGVSDSTCTW